MTVFWFEGSTPTTVVIKSFFSVILTFVQIVLEPLREEKKKKTIIWCKRDAAIFISEINISIYVQWYFLHMESRHVQRTKFATYVMSIKDSCEG